MDTAKEFEGKTLDEAIREACAYFDLPREKLEIEIVRDAKSGIFGLVGTRKAAIRARRAQVSARVGDILGAPPREPGRPAGRADAAAPRSLLFEEDGAEDAFSQNDDKTSSPARGRGRTLPRAQAGGGRGPVGRRSRRELETAPQMPVDAGHRGPPLTPTPIQTRTAEENFTDRHDPDNMAVPPDAPDPDALRAAVYDTACRLILPIVPDAELNVEIGASRVVVHIDSSEDLELLIGREGQTLASVQYLVARIVARLIGVSVRIQLNAGDYRERQDGKLRALALDLAERARLTGRACATRPLSSYQRRIVHMTLQDDPSVLTRSAGEGALKRVVIQRSRPD